MVLVSPRRVAVAGNVSLRTGRLGLLTACWVRAELDDGMRLNNWSIVPRTTPPVSTSAWL